MSRYRKGVVAVAVVLLCGAVALLLGLHGETPPAAGDAVVPGSVELPYFWQATVGMDPPGTAAVLFGGDSIGLYGDPWQEEGAELAVVGRNGDYRMLRFPGEMRAGQDVRLSPDGNFVASSWLTGGPEGWLVVTDLRTGRSRGFGGPSTACCYEIAAWRPDNGAVLVMHRLDPADVPPEGGNLMHAARYTLVDLWTGAVVPLGGAFEQTDVDSAWTAAFAPDGRRLVLTVPTGAGGSELRGYDISGAASWTRDLGDRRHLAGAGAYTPDGSAVATITLSGCVAQCDRAQLLARSWTVSYVDAATGADVAGPALPAVHDMAVRALGWHGTDLVVVAYEPETDRAWFGEDTGWGETRHVRVLALHPGGATSVLLDPPGDVSSVDIAQDLVRAGRFGGPVPAPSVLPVRWGVLGQGLLCWVVPLLVPVLVVIVIFRRVRRRRAAAAEPVAAAGAVAVPVESSAR